MNKTKNSIFNALTMICNTMIISILGLLSTNLIIKNYGSDVNGLVAIANQIVNMLMIIKVMLCLIILIRKLLILE